MLSEPAGQGHRQVRHLPGGAQPGLRQARHHGAAAFPADQRLDHRRRRPPGHIRHDRGQLDPGRLQRFLQPLDLRGAGLDRLHPVPCQVPHLPEILTGQVGAGQQPALVQIQQPDRVFRVGLMTLQRLGVRRVDHHHLGEIQLAQRVIHRVGIHPGRLHHHVRDTAAAQFAGHRLEHPVKRAELQHIGLAGPALRARHPDRDLDHVLVHIDRGHPVIKHSHAPPPEAAVVTNREHKARRPTGPLTSIRRLTHALAAAAGMTRNGDPSTRLGYGLERSIVTR